AVPGVYLFTYVWGQLPAQYGLILMLVALYFYAEYIDGSDVKCLIIWAMLAGALFSTHHYSEIVSMPLFTLTVLVQRITHLIDVNDTPDILRNLSVMIRRGVVAAATG